MPVQHDPRWIQRYNSSLWRVLKERFFSREPKTPEEVEQKVWTYAHLFGKPVWGGIIKAHQYLWEPGPHQHLYGMVVYAAKAPPDLAFAILPQLAKRIRELRLAGEAGWVGEDIQTFMRRVDDDHVTYSTFPVPEELSPGMQCFIAACLFDRQGLPDGYLKSGPLPMVLMEDFVGNHCPTVALHQKHWPASLRDIWKSLKSAPASTAVETEEFAATRVTGLPKELLDDLEEAVDDLCESQRLNNLFLNVGFGSENQAVTETITPSKSPDQDASGDLTLLGYAAEAPKLRQHLKHLLSQMLTAEQQARVQIQEMPMDEFDATYGWLVRKMLDE